MAIPMRNASWGYGQHTDSMPPSAPLACQEAVKHLHLAVIRMGVSPRPQGEAVIL